LIIMAWDTNECLAEVKAVMKLQVPNSVRNFLSGLGIDSKGGQLHEVNVSITDKHKLIHLTFNNILTLRLLMSYIYGAPSKARNANVVYIWTYVWQR